MCIFCKIVNKEIPNKTVLENDDFLAFEDISPQANIHVLVIPKKHIESFAEVDSDIMRSITPFIQKVTKKLGIEEDGYRLITNIRNHGGQEVPHLHFHILAGEKLRGLVNRA